MSDLLFWVRSISVIKDPILIPDGVEIDFKDGKFAMQSGESVKV